VFPCFNYLAANSEGVKEVVRYRPGLRRYRWSGVLELLVGGIRGKKLNTRTPLRTLLAVVRRTDNERKIDNKSIELDIAQSRWSERAMQFLDLTTI
jgi:hypothetical protein